MIKKLFLLSICIIPLLAGTTQTSKKTLKRCKKQNELLKEAKVDKSFLDEIISSKAGDFKDLKDENRKDKMKECE